MIAVITAMQNEAHALLRHAETDREYTLYGKKICEGRAFGKRFALIAAGIGKSNAAAAAMLALSGLNAKTLLNFGLAGGISQQAGIAEVFRIARAVQYDFDLSEVNGTPKGTLDEYDTPYLPLKDGQSAFKKATLATGDKLTAALADLPLLNALGADLRDMEGAAIAHVAFAAGVPLYAYKAVSNKIGADSVAQYREFTRRALEALSDGMEKIFAEIEP